MENENVKFIHDTDTDTNQKNIGERVENFVSQCKKYPRSTRYLAKMLKLLLTDISNDTANLSILYSLIGETRDIHYGQGEYNLAYMMIWEWYQFYPKMAEMALWYFVHTIGIEKEVPYGSWKDVKYLCNYVKDQLNTQEALEHPLVKFCIYMTNQQLNIDDFILHHHVAIEPISLVAKWIPREGTADTKFGWLYESLATDFFSHYFDTVSTKSQYHKALNKCKMDYRKMISILNRHLDTIQIKQCGGNWSKIDHRKTTPMTMQIQRNALLNIESKNKREFENKQRSDDPDRIECARRFREYIRTVKSQYKDDLQPIDRKDCSRYRVLSDFCKTYLSQVPEPLADINTFMSEKTLTNHFVDESTLQTKIFIENMTMEMTALFFIIGPLCTMFLFAHLLRELFAIIA
jgi:hypothetical protein